MAILWVVFSNDFTYIPMAVKNNNKIVCHWFGVGSLTLKKKNTLCHWFRVGSLTSHVIANIFYAMLFFY